MFSMRLLVFDATAVRQLYFEACYIDDPKPPFDVLVLVQNKDCLKKQQPYCLA